MCSECVWRVGVFLVSSHVCGECAVSVCGVCGESVW